MPIYDPNNPNRPLLSLAEQKASRLFGTLEQKQERISPTPEAIMPPSRYTAEDFQPSSSGSGLIDMMQSNIYRGAGNIADTWENIQQNAFGNKDYRLSESVDNLSDVAYADSLAGYTGRDEYNQDVQQLSDSYQKGNYWDTFTQALSLAPRALADSTSTALELGVGSLATAGATAIGSPLLGAVVGGTVFGNRVNKAVQGVKTAVTLADRIKNGAKATAKAVSSTSLYNADITESMRQDYKKEHNGKEPPAGWYSAVVPTNVALALFEKGAINKALPNFNKEAAKQVLSGTRKILESAGWEAAQEYLQTWQGILATKVEGKDLKELYTSTFKELGVKENQVEAAVASIMGGATGGFAKGLSTVPAMGLKAASKTAKATAKGAVNLGKNYITKQTFKVLPQEERDVLSSQYETAKTVADQKIADIDSKIDIVNNAESFTDLKSDEAVASFADTLRQKSLKTEADLSDPAEFKKLKDAVLSTYAADKTIVKTKLEGSNIARLFTKVGTNVKDQTVQKAKDIIGEETVDKVTKTAAGLSDTAIASIKNIQSGAALGLVNKALTEGDTQSKLIVTAAKDLSVGDLTKTIEVLKEKHPDLADQLTTKVLDPLKSAKEYFGTRTNTVTTAETIPKPVLDLVKNGKLDSGNAAPLATAINDVLNGKIDDLTTLKTMRNAVRIYKDAQLDPKQVPGSLTPTDITIMEGRLKSAKNALLAVPGERTFRAAKKLRKAVQKRIATDSEKEYAEFKKAVEDKGLKEYFSTRSSVKVAMAALDAVGAVDLFNKIKKSFPDSKDLENLQKTIEDKLASLEPDPEIVLTPKVENGFKFLEKQVKNLIDTGKIEEFKPVAAEVITPAVEKLQQLGVTNAKHAKAILKELMPSALGITEIDKFITDTFAKKQEKSNTKEPVANETIQEDETIRMEDPAVDSITTKVYTEKEINTLYQKEHPGCPT